jgi:hypothetical protein
MPFSIHINKPTKRAIAHRPECPEVPAAPTVHANNYWLNFKSEDEAETAREAFAENGYDAHWCECAACRPWI